MIERGCGASFLSETAQTLGIGGVARRQDLDGNFAAEPRVPRAVDFAHAAGAKQREDLVWSELRARSHRNGRGLSHLFGLMLARNARWDEKVDPRSRMALSYQ